VMLTCGWATAKIAEVREIAPNSNSFRGDGSTAGKPFFPKSNIGILWYDRVCRVKSWV
jgi:hypothetical protein